MRNLLNVHFVANTKVSAENILKIFKTINEVGGLVFTEREWTGNKSCIQILATPLTSWALNQH